MTEEIIMFNSKEAAQFKTNLSGWVSRDGIYYGANERLARYVGCTHRPCEDCGEPIEKSWFICQKCREKKDIQRYKAMPKEIWNEEGGIYSDPHNKFFWSWNEVEDYCHDNEIKEEDLRLVICEPQYPRLIEEDYFCDELADDGDDELPSEIVKAMEAFNRVLKQSAPLSWCPGNRAAIRNKINDVK